MLLLNFLVFNVKYSTSKFCFILQGFKKVNISEFPYEVKTK